MPFPAGFDRSSNKRIAEAVRKVENMRPENAPIARERQVVSMSPEVHFMQVVDLTPVSGRYKARIETFDSATGTITLNPIAPSYVWLVFANGFVPALSTSYEARRYGDVSGLALFRSAPTGTVTVTGSGNLELRSGFYPLNTWVVGMDTTIYGAVNKFLVGGAGTSPTADLIKALPFIVNRAATLDKLGVALGTYFSASGKVRLALYDSGADLKPNNLLADSGDIALDGGTAGTQANIWKASGSLGISLTANTIYWRCSWFYPDSANEGMVAEMFNGMAGGLFTGIGDPPFVVDTNDADFLNLTMGQWLEKTQSYGSAYPNPMGSMVNNPQRTAPYYLPLVAFKLSA